MSSHDSPERPLVRRESSSRYRYSGTPVYDTDAASLRSLDMRVAEMGESSTQLQAGVFFADLLGDNGCRAPGPDTALGTKVVRRMQSQGSDQQLRAIRNGALRFFPASSHTDNVQPPTQLGAVQVRQHDDEQPVVAAAVVFDSDELAGYCPHRLAKLHKQNVKRRQNTDQHLLRQLPMIYNLDGTIAPLENRKPSVTTNPSPLSPPQSSPFMPADVQRLSLCQIQPATAERPVPPRPSTISFGALHHIRNNHKRRHNYNHGTWRTRMKRTKCWRCELEARRTASMRMAHRLRRKCFCDGAAWADWWEGFKEKLDWSCFCRYRAYEDDDEESADAVRETEERARLGRLGGELT